ncbi:hypothetical protein NECID01_1447 [Nematocida sp. AWRm77]|nr:hypothetical protein NECID01_1447 [Nematocida sp. AWRm77]
MEQRGPEGIDGFEDVYYQEYRSQGTLLYTGDSLVSEPYAKDGYSEKDSTTYEYITYNEAFSVRTIVFYIPMTYLRK